MLTALAGTKDKVTGFNSGADDYLTKPFELEELLARVKALLRRSDRAPLSSKHSEILSFGPITLVPERFEAIWFDQPVRLTHLEFELLHCLLQRHGQTVAPSLILKEVWGYEPDDDIETIRVHIRHLRTKLEPDPRNPVSSKRYGAGYCLELPSGANLDDASRVMKEPRRAPGQQPRADRLSDQIQQRHLPRQAWLNVSNQVAAQLGEAPLHAVLGLLAPEMPLPPLQQPQLLFGIECFAHLACQRQRFDGLFGQLLQLG